MATTVSKPAKMTFNQLTTVKDFLETGQSALTMMKNIHVLKRELKKFLQIFLCKKIDGSDYFVYKICYFHNANSKDLVTEIGPKLVVADNHFDMLVIRTAKGNCILVSGDEGEEGRNDTNGFGIPALTISYRCLARMFDIKQNDYYKKVLAKLGSGEIEIVDFTKDETRKLTDAQRKQITSKKEVKPPELGFTLVQRERYIWHRAAYICFKDKKNNYYIMGQDEGSYFCSQLPETDKKEMTCGEALNMLAPAEATAASPRQGEWFAIKVNDKEVPPGTGHLFGSRICLPIDHPDSNAHTWSSVYDYRISGSGVLFVRGGRLSHSDHSDLILPDSAGWYRFVRNTARKSVSVQGVD